MNEKMLKNKKSRKLSTKSIVFWSFILIIVLVLIAVLIVKVVKDSEVKSYANVEMVEGSDIFAQEEDSYFVLFYDFENKKEFEDFDKSVYKYLSFVKANPNKEGAKKLYGMDSDVYINQQCFGDTTSAQNASRFPGVQVTGSNILKVKESDLPILLLVEYNEEKKTKVVTNVDTKGENAILAFLQTQMNK